MFLSLTVAQITGLTLKRYIKRYRLTKLCLTKQMRVLRPMGKACNDVTKTLFRGYIASACQILLFERRRKYWYMKYTKRRKLNFQIRSSAWSSYRGADRKKFQVKWSNTCLRPLSICLLFTPYFLLIDKSLSSLSMKLTLVFPLKLLNLNYDFKKATHQ